MTSKHYSYLVSSAIIEGIFVGFYIKTGIDASPINIVRQIIAILEPMTSENWSMQIEQIKFIVESFGYILWIPIIIGIVLVGWKKGLIVFIGTFVSIVLLIGYV